MKSKWKFSTSAPEACKPKTTTCRKEEASRPETTTDTNEDEAKRGAAGSITNVETARDSNTAGGHIQELTKGKYAIPDINSQGL
jgi:hypothetical protein